MSFFNSDIVKNEMLEINSLQQRVYDNVFEYPLMPKDKKLEHIEVLQELLEKQKLLYVRLSLSDDPEAKELKSRIEESIIMMGISNESNVNVVFDNLTRMVESMKNEINRA